MGRSGLGAACVRACVRACLGGVHGLRGGGATPCAWDWALLQSPPQLWDHCCFMLLLLLLLLPLLLPLLLLPLPLPTHRKLAAVLLLQRE